VRPCPGTFGHRGPLALYLRPSRQHVRRVLFPPQLTVQPHVDTRAAATAPPIGAQRPSTWRLWLAGVAGACGLVVAVVWGFWAVANANEHVDAFARVDVPGRMAVELAAPGTYHVYSEGDADVDLEDLSITVTGPDDEPVGLRANNGGIRYDIEGRVGRPIATFRADAAGSYVVVISDRLPGAAIAVGDSYGRRIVPHLAGAGLLLLSALACWSVLAILAALRHARLKEVSRR
jgi:hypothetical protein